MNRAGGKLLKAARSERARVCFALLLFGLALARALWPEQLGARIDAVTLSLLAATLLVLLAPIENLTNIKLAGIELVLSSAQVRGALEGALDRVTSASLREWLWNNKDKVAVAAGSRVLWVDDYPNEVLGERRILRALGVEVIPASTTEAAIALLREDADFDLLVTDVYRPGESYLATGFERSAEGTNFIVRLRSGGVPELVDIPYASRIPTIVYAAFNAEGLAYYTAPLADLHPKPLVTNDVLSLLQGAIDLLGAARVEPIKTPARKTPR